MDLSSSLSGLLAAFSNAEDVDRLERGGDGQGKTQDTCAKHIPPSLRIVTDVFRSLCAVRRIGE